MASSAEGVGLGFETLLGIFAVTTFLVGYSTVRLQASLQEWRERGERVINRLLEQNAGEDLLPLPTTLRSLSRASQKLKITSYHARASSNALLPKDSIETSVNSDAEVVGTIQLDLAALSRILLV